MDVGVDSTGGIMGKGGYVVHGGKASEAAGRYELGLTRILLLPMLYYIIAILDRSKLNGLVTNCSFLSSYINT